MVILTFSVSRGGRLFNLLGVQTACVAEVLRVDVLNYN